MCEWSSVYDHNNWGYSRSRYELGNKRVIVTHTVWDHLLWLWLTMVNCSWFIDWITCERVTMAGTGQGCGTRFHSLSFSMLCFVMCDVGDLWGCWCCGCWWLLLLVVQWLCCLWCDVTRSSPAGTILSLVFCMIISLFVSKAWSYSHLNNMSLSFKCHF